MRTYCVTGAASGLGKAVGTQLESLGSRVIGVDQHSVAATADLSSPLGRSNAVASVLDECDGVLAGLVPCAGLGPQHASAQIIAVNYFGAVAMLDGLSSALTAGSAVVLICSNSTTLTPGADGELAKACLNGDEAAALEIATDTHPAVAYAASKVALAKKMRTRVAELGAVGIRINAVAPGPFKSPLLQEGLDDPLTKDLISSLPIPLGRFGEPEEIAQVIIWLLSDHARYVHGSTLFVDGGIDALLAPTRFP